jgi:hypothetical protein
MSQHPPSGPPPTLLQVIGSVLSAAFGVQSDKNRERDQQGSAGMFIAVGAVGVILFVLAVYGVVKLVLSAAGG